MPQRNSSDRAAELAARRQRQLAAVPGITEVPSMRLARIAKRMSEQLTAEQRRLPESQVLSGAGFLAEFQRRMMAQLPPMPFGVRIARLKPSRNDSRAYRKQLPA